MKTTTLPSAPEMLARLLTVRPLSVAPAEVTFHVLAAAAPASSQPARPATWVAVAAGAGLVVAGAGRGGRRRGAGPVVVEGQDEAFRGVVVRRRVRVVDLPALLVGQTVAGARGAGVVVRAALPVFRDRVAHAGA